MHVQSVQAVRVPWPLLPLDFKKLAAAPIHGPDGRVALVRRALELRQTDFAVLMTELGGRVSRETVSHWENFDEHGNPRARMTRRNAGVIARLTRERLGIEEASEAMFFEPDETAWDQLNRRQLAMTAQIEELVSVVKQLQKDLGERD
jgi:transcriptional regulator with XRE-family HTH domain